MRPPRLLLPAILGILTAVAPLSPAQGQERSAYFGDLHVHTAYSPAERHYRPGTLTTFIGYEYTPSRDGGNLHRNVIFRRGAPDAGQKAGAPSSCRASRAPDRARRRSPRRPGGSDPAGAR